MKNILIAALLACSISLFAQTDQNSSFFKITQEKCLKNKGVKLILKEVLSDSRCPEDANCIWAGEAKVVVSVYDGKKLVKEETLTISESKMQENIAWFEQYLPTDKRNIESIAVLPNSKAGVKIKPKEYYIRIAYIK